jgi:shikimate dehydrogenase
MTGNDHLHQYGLIGFPLAQSFSQKYFTQKFAENSLTGFWYDLFPLSDITELPGLLPQQPMLKGFNITIPYKEKVVSYLHHLDPVVQACGACNCVAIRNGELWGYNTDVTGFKTSLLSLWQPHHHKALVLGTGGAAKAVQYVLTQLNIAFRLVSRHPQQNDLTYADLTPTLLAEYKLLINTTPLGMFPNIDACPQLPYESLGEQHYLYDLVYNPAQTLFLEKGAAAGAVTKNGYDMLVGQAEESWRIWSGDL